MIAALQLRVPEMSECLVDSYRMLETLKADTSNAAPIEALQERIAPFTAASA